MIVTVTVIGSAVVASCLFEHPPTQSVAFYKKIDAAVIFGWSDFVNVHGIRGASAMLIGEQQNTTSLEPCRQRFQPCA